MPKLKITGKHLSEDGKEICTHFSDGFVAKEKKEEEKCDLCYEGNCDHSCHSKHMDK